MAGSLARQDDVPKELHTDSIDRDAYDATPSCSTSDADKAAATAEPPKYIKGRLKAKLAFWKLFCTSTWVLSWISDGYQIPWGERGPPPPHAFANQQGALGNQEFVSKEIADLLARGSIMQTDGPPLVVSPLTFVLMASSVIFPFFGRSIGAGPAARSFGFEPICHNRSESSSSFGAL